jgi:polysaccharide export outer membrane protein
MTDRRTQCETANGWAWAGVRRWTMPITVTTSAAAAFALVVTAGCSATPLHRKQQLIPPPGTATTARTPSDGDLMGTGDRARIRALAAERARAPLADGYRIGPDDLLDIRIPDLLEAQAPAAGRLAQSDAAALPAVAGSPVFQQGIRVNGRGDLSLPMLGVVRAAGLTATALEGEIGRRLKAAGILRAPQVSVQIAEYRSGVVAVIGSVERPGLYPVTRPGATLADLIWAAGGPSKDAGRVVEFVGARPADAAPDHHRGVTAVAAAAAGHRRRPAAPSTRSPVAASPVLTRVAAQAGDDGGAPDGPIRVDLEVLLHSGGRGAGKLNPQVRPGDVISVAPAGSVQVDGWVEKPGAYPLSRGLTLSGAVAAAGGPLFPADRHRASVKRVLGAGEQRSFTVDLDAVAQGREADVPITDGDVVHLPAAPSRIAPWGLWSLTREIVHIGGSVPLF